LLVIMTGCRPTVPNRPPVQVAKVVPPVASLVPPTVASPTLSGLAMYRPTSRIFDALPASRATDTDLKVALTFDAGSDDSAVRAILEQLKQHHARATFFLTGRFCEEYPDSCKAIAEAGMEIGNHSYSHPHFTKRTDSEIKAQLDKADRAITKACGRSTRPLFRFPYGDCDRRTRQTVAQAGYQPIGWTLDSLDSVGRRKSAAFVEKRILKKIRPGYITLMHVSYPQSAAALPHIFDYLEKQHIRAVPVSELLLASAPQNGTRPEKEKPHKQEQSKPLIQNARRP